MKKFLSILCVSSLVFYCLCLGLFAHAADISIDGRFFGPPNASDMIVTINGVSYTATETNGGRPFIVIPLSPGVVYGIIGSCIINGSSRQLQASYGSSTSSGNPDSPTSVPYDDAYHNFTMGESSPANLRYFQVTGAPEPDPEPLEELGVSSGVSSFISWTGNVLTNLVMSPAVLVLVGLSIALLAILPWAISKIKQLIKGY